MTKFGSFKKYILCVCFSHIELICLSLSLPPFSFRSLYLSLLFIHYHIFIQNYLHLFLPTFSSPSFSLTYYLLICTYKQVLPSFVLKIIDRYTMNLRRYRQVYQFSTRLYDRVLLYVIIPNIYIDWTKPAFTNWKLQQKIGYIYLPRYRYLQLKNQKLKYIIGYKNRYNIFLEIKIHDRIHTQMQ